MADATAATSPTRRRLTRKDHHLPLHGLPASLGSAFRTVVRVAGDTFKIIAGEPNHLCKDRLKAAQDGCKDSAPDVERQSTRLPKETSRNCTPSVWGLYANVLRSVPKVQIWTRSQLHWVTGLGSVRSLDRQ